MAVSLKKQQQIKTLYQNGYSMVQIAHQLGCSASVVRYWLDKHNIIRRSISDAITAVYVTKFQKKPFRLKKYLSQAEEQLKVAGIMLYWGEGSKTGNAVKFANSDPTMVRLFVHFLRSICGISTERLKILMHLYPDQDEKELKLFWARIAGISSSQFYRSYIHIGRVGTYKKKSQYGTISLIYSDKKLLRIILAWIDEYANSIA